MGDRATFVITLKIRCPLGSKFYRMVDGQEWCRLGVSIVISAVMEESPSIKPINGKSATVGIGAYTGWRL